MADTFTADKIAARLQETGANENLWGSYLNDEAITYLAAAIADYRSLSVAGSTDVTLTAAQARSALLVLTGAISANINVVVPTSEGGYRIINNTTGAFSITVKTSGGTGKVIPRGAINRLWCDGTNVVFEDHTAATDVGKMMVIDANGAPSLAGPFTGARRNMLDNGGMMVAQRGSATGVGASGTQTVIDRWLLNSFSSASARWTISLEGLGGVSGHAPWMKLLCTTADASPGADEAQAIYQSVEAQNLYARMFAPSGTWRSSKLSFDIIVHKDAASSITFPATLCVFGQSQDGTVRTLVATFTVTAADTWQRVSVDIPADSTIAVNNDNGVGMTIGWGLYGGTNRQTGTTNAWQTAGSTVVATAASANLADAANNYLGITNVQWEVGAEATPFENVDLPVEEDRCFRWFERLQPNATSGYYPGAGMTYSSTEGVHNLTYRRKRTAPTVTLTAANTFAWLTGGGVNQVPSGVVAATIETANCVIVPTLSAAATGGGILRRDTADTSYIDISAE